MENRFLATDDELTPVAGGNGRSMAWTTRRTSRTRSLRTVSRALSADQRALVVLIENGGVDLGIPVLVDKLLGALPQAHVLPESARQELIVFVRDTIKRLTDTLLESAELAINRYGSAAPEFFGTVTVLRNGAATYNDLSSKLSTLSRDGKIIDLLILTHGGENQIAVNGGVTGEQIRQMRAEFGRPLSLRSVYMMNCVGSSLNQAWIDAGAKVSSGSIRNNYLPEPTTHFFFQNWLQGQNFETAVTSAYRKTVNMMNDAVVSFLGALSLPGSAALAKLVDFENMEFVRDSAPVIQGQRTLSIASDDLAFAQTMASTLATTVLPLSALRSMSVAGGASGARMQRDYRISYHSPSTMMTTRERYSRMQNPAVLIGGMAVADAAQIGLGAAAIVQAQASASAGSFQLTYDKAQRLLTPDARNRMPGAQQAKSKYSRSLLYIGSSSPIMDFAEANIVIEWEGNPHGEIGTPVIRRDLKTSSDWSRSSASVSITKLDRIPVPGSDPRAWPLVYGYEGTFDPVGNGHFEFSGEFEINAFGGLKFNRHEVISRSLIDGAIGGNAEDYVVKGGDVIVPVPDVPQEQIEYLKSTLP